MMGKKKKLETYQNYEDISPDFYDASIDKANLITKYYHHNRYEKIRKYVLSRYSMGMKILDIGSGSVRWNNCDLPVTGVDINKKMLDYAQKKGRIEKGVVWNLDDKGIPLKNEHFDFVILSDVLEHLEDPRKILNEAVRLLKKQGFLIITVPLDSGLSPWRVLFEIGCFIRGDILGQEYFKKRCGHIQHFSVKDVASMLEDNGFSIIEKNITILNIGILAKKHPYRLDE